MSPQQLRHNAETCDELKQGPFANDFRWAADEIDRLRAMIRVKDKDTCFCGCHGGPESCRKVPDCELCSPISRTFSGPE